MSAKTSVKYWALGTLLALFAIYQLLAPGKDAIHIAYVGSTEKDGRSIIQGIELYLKQINQNGGIDGKKIILDIFDDQNDPVRAREKAQEIAAGSQAVAVIGHIYSACSISGGEVYQQYGVPAITAVSTNVEVTAGNDWYFRVIYNDDFQGRFLANYVKAVLGQNAVSIIYEDLAYGSYLGRVFEQAANKQDLQVKYKWGFEVNDPNLDQRLQQITTELQSKEDAGVIFLATHLPEGIRLVALLKDAGIQNLILTPHAFSNETFPQSFAAYPKEKQQPGYYTNDIYPDSFINWFS
jgi:potassium efflux system protein